MSAAEVSDVHPPPAETIIEQNGVVEEQQEHEQEQQPEKEQQLEKAQQLEDEQQQEEEQQPTPTPVETEEPAAKTARLSEESAEPPSSTEKEPESGDCAEEQPTSSALSAPAAEADSGSHGSPPDTQDPDAAPKSSLEKIDFIRDAQNRVKLYVLCDQRVWDDRGTGHVTCVQFPDQPDMWCIIVRLESTEKNVLESPVKPEVIYQKQQGTLIVWSENETCDLALSFQEKTGCSELWERICRIQGKDPDAMEEAEEDEAEQEPSDSSTPGASPAVSNGSLSLPPCTLQHLTDLEMVISNSTPTAALREKMSNAMLQHNYIPKLCELFRISEDLDNVEGLHLLYSIAKNLFLLNNNALLAELLDENNFRHIVGMLEHDPAYPEPRKHREFLWEKSHFQEALPIRSDELRAKIHQTYRVQYVQDVCLPAPSLFEENLLTVLTSHLFFNRSEIVSSLLNDKELMKQLFDELKDRETSQTRQKDLTNFLKEFCSFAHSLQPNGPQGRETFFKTLMANDVLSTIDPCISSPLKATRTATVEMLQMIVDFNPHIFREYLIKQARTIPDSKNDDLLINKLIRYIYTDRDPELTSANQMSLVIRILLDPDSVAAKTDKSEFVPLFYKRAMYTLCKPLTDNIKDDKPVKDTYYTANQLALTLDLISFCVEHHSYSMRQYVINKDLYNTILVFLKSRHHFLALTALRSLRRVVQLKDEFYNRYIKDRKVIDRVVQCFKDNGPRYNLLNSALIEFFEFIRTEDIRTLMDYVMANHWESFKEVTYVKTFQAMHTRYEQFEHGRRERRDSSLSGDDTRPAVPLAENAHALREREYDEDELFFSKDDDEEWPERDRPAPVGASKSDDNEPLPQRKSGMEQSFPSVLKKKATNEDEGVASIFGGASTTPSISGPPRPNRIVIRMNSGERKSPSPSPPPAQHEQPTTTTQSPEKEAPPLEAVVSSSTTSYPAASSSSNDDDEKDAPKPVILKQGFSGLVDYDASDSDEEENGNDECSPSTSTSAAKNGAVKSEPPTANDAEDSVVSSTSSNGSPVKTESKFEEECPEPDLFDEVNPPYNGESIAAGAKRRRLDSGGSPVAKDTIALMEDAGELGDAHPSAKKLKFEEVKPEPTTPDPLEAPHPEV